MSEYPAPETLSRDEFQPYLIKLRLLFDNLPGQLPSKDITESAYASFVNFEPDEDVVELTGSKVGALNMHLERTFGFKARSEGDGVVPIIERGSSICMLHGILEKYCQEYPDDNILKKWVLDLVKAAEKVYTMYGIAVCSRDCYHLILFEELKNARFGFRGLGGSRDCVR